MHSGSIVRRSLDLTGTTHAREQGLRPRKQLVRGASLNKSAGGHDGDAVAAHDALQLVRDEQHRGVRQRLAVQQVQHRVARSVPQVCRDLVEAHDAGPAKHRPRQRQQLPVTCLQQAAA